MSPSRERRWRSVARSQWSRVAAVPARSAIRLTAAWVAAALDTVQGTIVSGNLSVEFGGVSIDTRTLSAGDLFIAIRGEHFDGAQFAQAALDGGAAGVVVPRGRGRSLAASAQTAVIEAEDTTSALQALARAVRR